MTELFERIAERVGDAEAFFVGGCVRDYVLGAPTRDVDLAVRGDTWTLGRRIGSDPGSHVFWLRQDEQVVRVLLPASGEEAPLQVDLVPLRGSLEEDLRARDLTINAMALPARRHEFQVLDPLGGRDDLKAGIVRFVTPASPESDPLRTLRALRFRWKLGFRLEAATEIRVRECVPLLSRVSTERVRDELFQLLAMPPAADALAECLHYGMARWLFGVELAIPQEEGAYGPAPAGHIARVQALLAEVSPDLQPLLATFPTAPRKRRELLLWAAALQPLAPPLDPAAAGRYLALSNDERQIIARAVTGARAAGELLGRWPAPGRAVRRFLRAAGPEAVLLSAAGPGGGWSAAHAELLERALRHHYWPEEPLLTGVEVMQIMGLEPGPRVGALLEEVEDARADGLLRSPAEAASWLRERAPR